MSTTPVRSSSPFWLSSQTPERKSPSPPPTPPRAPSPDLDKIFNDISSSIQSLCPTQERKSPSPPPSSPTLQEIIDKYVST